MFDPRPLVLLVLLVALVTPALAVDECLIPSSGCIVINEIMYDDPGVDEEFVELYNDCGVVVDLTGWYLLDDVDTHDRCLLEGTLQPGEYLVVPNVTEWFQAKYPGVTNLNPNPFDDFLQDPEIGFVLGDGGDQVRLFNNLDLLQDCVAYNDTAPWRCEADGPGPSLELYNPQQNNELAGSWGYSLVDGGTPGEQNSIYTPDAPPVIQLPAPDEDEGPNPAVWGHRQPALPSSSDTVTVTAYVTDQIGLSSVELLVDTGSGYVAQPMFDDGAHGDGPAGNSTYGAFVDPQLSGTRVRYRFRATDTFANVAEFPFCLVEDYFAYTVDHKSPELVVNEIVASNQNGIIDPDDPEVGEREDWLEIKNRSPYPVNVGGMFMANSLVQSLEWQLPDVVIEPGCYLLIWADDDEIDGRLHTNFKLNSGEGSEVAIFETVDHGNVRVHGFRYGKQNTDLAYGYKPEDSDFPEFLTTPTPCTPVPDDQGLSVCCDANNEASEYHSGVVINEFQTTSAMGGIDDWVEFYNRGDTLKNLQGYHITDERDQPFKYTAPPGLFISPGFYISLDEMLLGFSWSSTGAEIIQITSASHGAVDFYDYGPQSYDISQGRYPNETPNWHFFPVDEQTRGNPNSCGSAPPLDAVEDLLFDSQIDPKNVFTWDHEVIDAEDWDIISVDVGALVSSGGDYTTAMLDCVRNNAPSAISRDATEPAPGGVIGYIVRATNFSCQFGTYDAPTPNQQQGARDDGIAAAEVACP